MNANQCPICTLHGWRCDHEMVRWSLIANEPEPACLEDAVLQLCYVVKELFVACLAAGAVPSDASLAAMYEGWSEEPQDDMEDATDIEYTGMDLWLFQWAVEQMRDWEVVKVTADEEVLVIWAESEDIVRDRLRDWRAKVGADTARVAGLAVAEEERAGRGSSVPRESSLRSVASAAVAARGLDLVLSGPYRWGDPGSPRISVYQSGLWPPEEHRVFFLGSPRVARGLTSSQLVLMDKRGPTVVEICSAGDEG